MERETGKMNKGTMARTLRMGFAVLALGIVAAPTVSLAQEGAAVNGLKLSNSKAPVKIDADKLEMRDKEGIAIFTGNVAVSQGDALLKAGQMTVYYNKAKKDGEAPAPEPTSAGVGGLDSSSIDHIDISGKSISSPGRRSQLVIPGVMMRKTRLWFFRGRKWF